MKKLLTILAILSIIMTVNGCSKNPENTTPNQTNTTQQTTETTTEPTVSTEIHQKPMYAVSFAPKTETLTDSSGEDRFLHSYQNISLVLPEPEIADRIILDYLSRMDQVAQYAESLKNDSLNSQFYYGIPFMYCISYTPMRFDTILLSLHEDEMIFMGGIHPNTYGHFYTYDLLSGEKLTLSDVLTEGITTKIIIYEITEKIANTEGLWENYNEVISELFDVGLSEYESWYFSDNGLCFYFDPYILAPYAAGPITVEIPYSELVGTLKDEYFPAENDYCKGNILAENFTLNAQENFTQFAEVVLVEDGAKILLSAEGAITDIAILAETVEDGTKTVMAVQSLTPGDAIMVEFDPATTKLLVNYRNGDQYETKTINYASGTISIS